MDIGFGAGRAVRAFFGMVLLSLAGSVAALAQEPSRRPPAIQDNSFLLEEAYNQEAGVVQHINTFSRAPGGEWSYTFTQEWPFFGEKNQLSYTLPLSAAGDGGGAGLGDVALNYRYQLVGSAETRVAVAPRLTVLLPTGSARAGRGSGGAAVQVNFPLSFMAADRLALHSNVGATLTPRASDGTGAHAATTAINVGQSAIWLATPNFNLMLESVWMRAGTVLAERLTGHETTFLISPGARGAINAAHGLQIVPGVALPMGVGPSAGERSLFLYLSFEHPF